MESALGRRGSVTHAPCNSLGTTLHLLRSLQQTSAEHTLLSIAWLEGLESRLLHTLQRTRDEPEALYDNPPGRFGSSR